MARMIEPYDDFKELRKDSLTDRWSNLRKQIFKNKVEPSFDHENKIQAERDRMIIQGFRNQLVDNKNLQEKRLKL